MNFYNHQHKHYCGIDLHARSLYICIMDQQGEVLLHKECPANAGRLLELITPFLEDLVLGVECMHSTRSPDSFYLLHPCSRAGTGLPISVKNRIFTLSWVMPLTCGHSWW